VSSTIATSYPGGLAGIAVVGWFILWPGSVLLLVSSGVAALIKRRRAEIVYQLLCLVIILGILSLLCAMVAAIGEKPHGSSSDHPGKDALQFFGLTALPGLIGFGIRSVFWRNGLPDEEPK
jgi:hypothetical protein